MPSLDAVIRLALVSEFSTASDGDGRGYTVDFVGFVSATLQPSTMANKLENIASCSHALSASIRLDTDSKNT